MQVIVTATFQIDEGVASWLKEEVRKKLAKRLLSITKSVEKQLDVGIQLVVVR